MTENVRRADTKLCKRCGYVKELTQFYKALDKEARCKPCVSELRAESYKKDRPRQVAKAQAYRNLYPDRVRDSKLKQAYGVGNDYYEAKLKEQGGVCAGCKRHVKTIWRGKIVKMSLDHDHKTGKPRGVLCIKCNRALGLLEENTDTFNNLKAYIKKYQK